MLNTFLKLIVALLLLELAAWGGVQALRQILDFRSAVEYWAGWQQERIEAKYWRDKVACARKLNGCELQATELKLKRSADLQSLQSLYTKGGK